MGRLLAKKLDERIKNTEELYLIPHLKAVESVGDLLSKSVGKKILYSVGLDSSIWEERLKVILPLSCLLHSFILQIQLSRWTITFQKILQLLSKNYAANKT